VADDTRASSSGSSGELAERSGRPELPPLRVRGSLAARIVALVLLVVLGTAVSALIIVDQVRGLRANFDLLTGVYVPFQTELVQAQMQSHQIATFVAGFGNPEVQLDRADMHNLEDAIDRRATELAEARVPLTQAIAHSDRLGGASQLEHVHKLAGLLDELEQLVQEGIDPNEVLANASRQNEIARRFRELQKLTEDVVAEQRITVAEAGREAEQRAVIVTIVVAVVSLVATLLVILTLRPLRRLADSVRRIGRGDWSERIEVGSRPERDDEVARLAREVNLMAAALEERERRLLHGERLAAIGRLAAQITHEIRNPLSSVALNAELLEDELAEFGEDSQEARLLLTRISNEVDRLTQITEAYLGFARRPAPQLAKIDLVAELGDLLDFLAEEHERDGLAVVRELPSEPVWVEADAGQLRQAFINLLRNAQEALLELGDQREAGEPAPGEGSPTLRVKLDRKDDRASVLVSDTGPGIAIPDDQTSYEHIFEAFVTSKAHGTGLGLPMVQQVALDHGGSVRLVETGPTGTTFEFSLPACDPPSPSVSSPNLA
jgi:two-component system NtrC family sensor kinase